MSDLIRRADAIDAIRTLQTFKLFAGDDMVLIDKAEVQTELMMLPSAEPPYKYSEAYVEQIRTERDFLQDMVNNMAEPKTGKWSKPITGTKYCICPNCGNRNYPTKYCPDCGNYNGE